MNPVMNFMNLILLLFCLAGFCIIVMDQVMNWYGGKTSTATEIKRQDMFDFPVLVFCADKPFKKGFHFKSHLTQDQFDSQVNNFDINLSLVNRYRGDPEAYVPKYEKEYLYTQYNGRCIVFTLLESVGLRRFAVFTIKPEMPLSLFYLQDPGEQLYLTSILAELSMPAFSLQSSSFVGLGQTVYKMQNKDGNSCIESKANFETYSQCLAKELKRHFILRNVTCVPLMLRKFLPEFENKLCEDEIEGDKVIAMSMDIISDLKSHLIENDCLIHCTTVEYQGKKLTFDMGKAEGNSKSHIIDMTKYGLYMVY